MAVVEEGGGGVDLIKLTYLFFTLCIWKKTALSIQCRPRSDAAIRGA